METFGNFWKHLKKHLEKFGNFWKHLETFGNIWKHLEAFGNIWKHLKKHLETFKKTFGKIWKLLKTSATPAADRLYFFAIPALSKPLFKSPRTDDTVITVVGCVAISCATVASIAI